MVADAVGSRRFRRLSDGVLGLGYYIEWAGLRQASVAWPDIPSVRYVPDDFNRGVIEDIGPAFPVSVAADHECKIELIDGKYVCGGVAIHQACGEECKLGEKVDQKEIADILGSEIIGESSVPHGQLTANAVLNEFKDQSQASPSLEVNEIPKPESDSLAVRDRIGEYLVKYPEAPIPQVIEHLATENVYVTAEQVAKVRERVVAGFNPNEPPASEQ